MNEQAKKRAKLAALLRQKRETFPLSSAQKRLWFLNQMLPQSHLYHVPAALCLSGTIDLDKLEQCVNVLVQRHTALRTVFVQDEHDPQQIVRPHLKLTIPVQQVSQSQLHEVLADALKEPFSLENGPLVRVRLFRITPTEHVLFICMHHIISDAWSMSLFFKELFACYDGTPLVPVAYQYPDFAIWQAAQTKQTAQQIAYWVEKLQGADVVLNFPSDYARPAQCSYIGAEHKWELDQTIAQKIVTFCNKTQSTAAMFYLAAFQLLLQRYTHQNEFVVGIPIANRTRTEFERVIGFFVNTLPIRAHIDPQRNFYDLLNGVRDDMLDAYDQQSAPLDQIVEKLQLERLPNISPLFQVMFDYQSTASEQPLYAGVPVRPIHLPSDVAKFDFTLFVDETAPLPRLRFEYATELFSAETITRFARQYETVLADIIAHPDKPIADLQLLPAEEAAQLVEWNNTLTPFPQEKTVPALFAEQAAKTPHAIAVSDQTGQTLTYQALEQQANRAAHYLQAQGVQPGDYVALYMTRSLDLMVAILATLKAGAAYVPLDLAYPPERIALMLEDSNAALLLTHTPHLPALPQSETPYVCWDKIGAALQASPLSGFDRAVSAETLAYVIYTSGSTGRPKGVQVTHHNIARLVCNVDYVKLTEQTIFLHHSPIAFDAATLEIWGPLLNGGRVVFLSPTAPTLQEFADTLRNCEITTLFVTTALFNNIMDEDPLMLAGLEQLFTGGEAHSVAHVQRAHALLPQVDLNSAYGPTECTTFTTTYPIPPTFSEAYASVPLGRPIANTTVYILDENFQQLPIGVPGELCIGADGVAQGYLNRPKLSAEKFIPDPFSSQPNQRLYRSGDIARYLPDGNLEFIGRIDHQVKIRGFRIELSEIEYLLNAHPEIKQCLVVANDDTVRGKHIVAYLVPTENFDQAQVNQELTQHLPAYMLPTGYVLLDLLPLTPNGKVNRAKLPPLPQITSEHIVLPRNTLETVMCHLWGDLLQRDTMSIEDNFFALGGHSLLATQLLSRVRKAFRVKLPLVALFESPTISAFSERLQQAEQQAGQVEKIATLLHQIQTMSAASQEEG